MPAERSLVQPGTEVQERLKVALSEYESLRAEIVSRYDAQQTLFQYALIIAGASVPILLNAFEKQQFVAFLTLPWLFGVTGALWSGHAAVTNQLNRYLDERLGPEINRLLDALGTQLGGDHPLIGYNEFMYSVLMKTPETYFVHGVPLLIMHSFWAIPSIVSLAIWHTATTGAAIPPSSIERVIFYADCVIIVGVLVSIITSGLRFATTPWHSSRTSRSHKAKLNKS